MNAAFGVLLCMCLVTIAIVSSLWCDLRRAARANRNLWAERFLLLVAGALAAFAFLMAYLIGEMP